jgi:hypothetical protein
VARLFVLIAACLCVTACSAPVSVKGQRVGGSSDKVTAMRTTYVPAGPNRMQQQSGTTTMKIYTESMATEAERHFDAMFREGIQSQLPALAETYGVSILPTASAELRLRTVRLRTYCTSHGCQNRIDLHCELIKDGRAIWHGDMEAGQRRAEATDSDINDRMFDVIATGLLSTMKKDGVI